MRESYLYFCGKKKKEGKEKPSERHSAHMSEMKPSVRGEKRKKKKTKKTGREERDICSQTTRKHMEQRKAQEFFFIPSVLRSLSFLISHSLFAFFLSLHFSTLC